NGSRRLKVKGSPNLQGVRTIMIGVRNPDVDEQNPWQDDAQPKCAIIWVNELRLTDFVSEGGSAAVAQMQIQAADFANVAMSANYSGLNWGSVESRVQDRQRNEKIGFDLNSNVQLGQFFGKKTGLSLPFFYGYSLGLINPEYDPFNPDIRLDDYSLQERREKAKSGQDYTERKSYNFTNVRKAPSAGSKPSVMSISNFAVSYAYTEVLKRDFNTSYDRTKTWNAGLVYAYNFQSKPLEPFKNVKFMNKSKHWKIIQDMNLFYLPKSIGFSNDLIRNYNERQVRNNLVPDFEFAPVYFKQFNWNRKYNLGYDITKNLKMTFNAGNRSIFDEDNGRVDKKEDPESYQVFVDSIRSQLPSLGKTMDYSHDYQLTYNVPFDKIQVLNFMSGNLKYGGTYNWQRAPLGQSEYGNVIQNNRNFNATGQVNMTNLYNKIPYFKRVNNSSNTRARATTPNAGVRVSSTPGNNSKTPKVDTKDMTRKELRIYKREVRKEERKERINKNKNKPVPTIPSIGARMLMTVRNISGTYTQNDGTLLPGYNQGTTLLGFNDSFDNTLSGFIFGKQSYGLTGNQNGYDIARYSANQGWLVRNEDLNRQHTISHSTNLSGRASLEPFKDVNIELTMTKTFTTNATDFFRWNESTQQYESQSRVEIGNLTYSNITIGTAFARFDRKNSYSSPVFDKMRENLVKSSEILGQRNTNSTALASGYYDGYGLSQQEVVLGSFLATYSNKEVSEKSSNPLKNTPLPNWTINYNGLTKFNFFKKLFRNFVIRHGYSSTTSISGIQTNLDASFDSQGQPTARDLNNNFIAQNQIQNVTLSERFSPLIGLDATWIIKSKGKDQGLLTKFELKKDRSATLSLNNNQVTEIMGTEWVIGSGYKFTQVQLPIRNVKSSDVNIRFDLSFRDNLTVIRKVVENTNQATAGQRVVSIKASADYNLSQNLTIQYYYDHVINTPRIASSYPTGNLSTGIRLRFNLGGI
ncbi:MAG: cell surface protein SprA, partial [Bacteroidetes bacterium]|nr:cell surface protein SprA [Bacteroidota bacterium]